ncbi:unnamed protein product, partial [Phaeothamnion confervicola]
RPKRPEPTPGTYRFPPSEPLASKMRGRIFPMKRCLLFAILLVHMLAAGAQGSLEVVPLRNRSAEQVMPILRP